MNYKKEIKDNYTLHLINTDRFKTIDVSIKLTKKYDKNEFAYLKLLEKVMRLNSTKKYSKSNDLSKELERLYNSRLNVKTYVQSKNMVFDLSVSMVNPKYTMLSVYDDVFNLFKEFIYNQSVFDDELFINQKNALIKNILNVKDSSDEYASVLFEEIFYKDTVYSENNLKNISIFEGLSNKELYKVYTSLFNSYKIDVVVLGELEEDIIKDNVSKLLKGFSESNNYYKDLMIKIDEGKIKESIVPIDVCQSNLLIGCTTDSLTDKERNYVLPLYNAILGCMNNSILFVNVREKNSLCYYIGSTINRYTDTIVIESGFSSKNYDLAISLIKDCLNDMSKYDIVSSLIDKGKKTLDLAFNDFYDNKNKIMIYYFMNEFTYIPSIEERRKFVNECSIEDINKLAKKVKIKDIFMLKGEDDEEEKFQF